MHAYHPVVPDLTLWVDPGESTGWAAWVTPPATVEPLLVPRFYSGQAPWRAVCEDLYSVIWQFRGFVSVGWEDYLLLPGSRHHDLSALKVIGFLEWLTGRQDRISDAADRVGAHWSHRPHVLAPQPSSNRLLGANKLQQLGWFRPGERDSNSAAAHLLSHLLVEGLLPGDLLALVLPSQEVSSGGC
jgi:hypothetical protein